MSLSGAEMMKKALIFVAIVFELFLFSACKVEEKSTLNFEGFSKTVSFFEDGTELCGNFEYRSADDMSFVFQKPESLKGIKLQKNKAEWNINFDEIRCRLENPEKVLNTRKGFETLFEVFAACTEENPPQKQTKTRYKGVYAFGEAVFSVDENGEITALRAGEYDYKFT